MRKVTPPSVADGNGKYCRLTTPPKQSTGGPATGNVKKRERRHIPTKQSKQQAGRLLATTLDISTRRSALCLRRAFGRIAFGVCSVRPHDRRSVVKRFFFFPELCRRALQVPSLEEEEEEELPPLDCAASSIWSWRSWRWSCRRTLQSLYYEDSA